MNIDGQAAIVTGAASGLGYATAVELHSHGAKVALLDIDENVKDLALQANGTGYQCDIGDAHATEKAIAAACTAHGPARATKELPGKSPMWRLKVA